MASFKVMWVEVVMVCFEVIRWKQLWLVLKAIWMDTVLAYYKVV